MSSALLTALTCAPLCAMANANDNEDAGFTFNSAFLVGGSGSVDLSRYVDGNPVDPGIHYVDIRVNGESVDRREVLFVGEKGNATACLPRDVLSLVALKAEYLSEVGPVQARTADPDDNACVDLPHRIPGATVDYDVSNQQLNIGIPQAALTRSVRGHVNPALWDSGVSAAFFNYDVNSIRNDYGRSSYLGVTAGLNLAGWRVRHRGSWAQSDVAGTNHQNIATYAYRVLPKWRSQLLVGESNTSGELFDSQAFLGIRLASDQNMLPDSLRGYAPVVRGVAETQARVSIRQNGFVIHEMTVPPGPFEITDLYPTSFGGDLEVTITEADGREQNFTVNFAAVPQALREGVSNYSAAVGRLNRRNGGDPWYAQFTYARGLSNRFTLLSGVEASEGYTSGVVGTAINTSIGAVGADLSYAVTQLPGGDRLDGTSVRVNYQRHLAETGTNFGLAAYRYSTDGYMTLSEAASVRDYGQWGGSPGVVPGLKRAKHRLQLDFSQRLGEKGSLFARGGYTRFWDSDISQTDYQVGYQGRLGVASYAASAMRTRDMYGRNDDSLQLNFSVPLGKAFGSSATFNTGIQRRSNGDDNVQATLSGTAGSNNELSYNVGASQTTGHDANYGVSGQYRSPYGTVSAGYSQHGGGDTLSLAMSGAMVAHKGGINFAPPLGETFGIVEMQGAKGTRFTNNWQSRIARNGHGVVPYLTPYRWNEVAVDVRSLSDDVDLEQGSFRIAPTEGAVAKLSFSARVDHTVYVRMSGDGGQALPFFGSDVLDENGIVVGMLGQGGLIQVRGAQDQGRLTLRVQGVDHCMADYDLSDARDAHGMRLIEVACDRSRLADDHDSSLPHVEASAEISADEVVAINSTIATDPQTMTRQ